MKIQNIYSDLKSEVTLRLFWRGEKETGESETGTKKKLRGGTWSLPLQQDRVSLAFLLEMTENEERLLQTTLHVLIYPRFTLLSKANVVETTSKLSLF